MRVDYFVVFPEAVHALGDLDRHERAALGAKLPALIGLRASQLNGCGHCVDVYATNDEQRLRLLSSWQNASVLEARQRAALGWCDTLTLLPVSGTISEAYERLSAQFDPNEIVALTAAIIAVNGSNRLHIGVGPPTSPHGTALGVPALSDSADPRVRRLAARLEELEAELTKVREDNRRALEGPPGPRYYESGTIMPELDDQAITLPG